MKKPTTFSADLARLPAALLPLTKAKRWLVWRWEKDGEKWTKPPFKSRNPDKHAANNKPATWSSYHDAVTAVKEGKANGIGYVLTPVAGMVSNIAALDLDKCRNPDNGALTTWAREIVRQARRLGAYVEITVSGTGLRVIGLGENGQDFNVKLEIKSGGAVELYRRAVHFITVSGLEIGKSQRLPNIDSYIDVISECYAPHKSKRKHKSKPQSSRTDEPIDRDLIIAALEYIAADDYWIWLEVGAALHFELGDDGFELFDIWSATSRKYNADQCAAKWVECAKFTQYTGATILFYADQAMPGWRSIFQARLWDELSFFGKC